MNERWRVEHGSYGAWRVFRGGKIIAAFYSWHRSYQYAREQAALENLNVISIEICS